MSREARTGWLETYSVRLRMVLLFVGAVAVMIAHHCFYRYLNRKAVGFEDGLSEVGYLVIYYSSSIANVMTVITKGLLAAILGIVFAQIFWMQTRREDFGVQQINDSLACKDSPLQALKNVRSAFLFSAITFLSLSLVVITIFAPGAVDFYDTSFNHSCEVQTVDLANASIAVVIGSNLVYRNPIAQAKGFVAQVLLSGGPLPPKVVYDKFGGDTAYNLTFNAPSLVCTNISDSFDFASALPNPVSDTDNILVWNAVKTLTNGSLELTVATRELIPGQNFTVTPGDSNEAVSCVPYESTYDVQVDTGVEDGSVPIVSVKNMTALFPLSPFATLSGDTSESTEVQHYAIVDALTSLLNGSASYDPTTYDFTDESPIVAYSPMGAALADSPWFWTEHMLTALPKLMENVSVSILSNILSETNFPTLVPANTTCRYGNVYYIYKPLRLFLPYGIGLLIGALGIALGFYAIHANGREESLDFTLILQFVTKKASRLTGEKGESGSDPQLFPCCEELV